MNEALANHFAWVEELPKPLGIGWGMVRIVEEGSYRATGMVRRGGGAAVALGSRQPPLSKTVCSRWVVLLVLACRQSLYLLDQSWNIRLLPALDWPGGYLTDDFDKGKF